MSIIQWFVLISSMIIVIAVILFLGLSCSLILFFFTVNCVTDIHLNSGDFIKYYAWMLHHLPLFVLLVISLMLLFIGYYFYRSLIRKFLPSNRNK